MTLARVICSPYDFFFKMFPQILNTKKCCSLRRKITAYIQVKRRLVRFSQVLRMCVVLVDYLIHTVQRKAMSAPYHTTTNQAKINTRTNHVIV
jgi:hypothetical protein